MTGESTYLLALYVVSHREEPPVSPGVLAEELDRTAGTAVDVCHRLADAGLVEYEPYEGVAFTDEGRERAAALHERYATLSWFFREVLDLEDHEREAMAFADALSPEVVERLAWLLGGDLDEAPAAALEGDVVSSIRAGFEESSGVESASGERAGGGSGRQNGGE